MQIGFNLKKTILNQIPFTSLSLCQFTFENCEEGSKLILAALLG